MNHNYVRKTLLENDGESIIKTPSIIAYDYTNLEHFDTSRLISISWLILDNKNEIVNKSTYFIKPDGFEVSPQVSKYISALSTLSCIRYKLRSAHSLLPEGSLK